MRYITQNVKKDLDRKMVLISGPRQSGKTTVSKEILKWNSEQGKKGTYLNWDDSMDRTKTLKRSWDDDCQLIVLDEIHKYKIWKRWLKGLYDTTHPEKNYLITGSARLDIYRKGGDSMVGRYFSWRLHPFCMAERPSQMSLDECFRRLLEVGGFPEPFLLGDPIDAKRWRQQRRERVIREDIRDLESIRDLTLLSVLHDLLAARVGGPTVYSSLAEDLQVASKTVKHWIEVFERMYLVFCVRPYSKSLPRSLQKVPKVYFYDTGEIVNLAFHSEENDGENKGARFENLVATHLLKRLHYLEDSTGDRYELQYLRDKEGHEVDFVILKNRKPVCLIEAKWAESHPHSGLTYFGDRLGVKNRIQLVGHLKEPSLRNGISILRAADWLSQPLDQAIF